MVEILDALLAACKTMGHDPLVAAGSDGLMTEIAYFAEAASDREVADRLDLLARLLSDVAEVFGAKAVANDA